MKLNSNILTAALAFGVALAQDNYPICIIGAGPAGLSAASRLESQGKETVIFEKQAAVGGKCQAYYDNGTFHPLGALLFTNTTYRETLKIIHKAGVPSTLFLDNLPKWDYDWKTGVVTPAPILTDAFTTTLGLEVKRYIAYWEQDFAPTMAEVGYKNGVPAAYTVSTAQWLADNSYMALPVVFNEAMVSFGYGDLGEVPILYMLQFFAPDVLLGYTQTQPGSIIDFHKVFECFSETIKGPINLNVSIKAIDRSGGYPTITWGSIYPPSPRPSIQTCSSLILAFPPTIPSLQAAGITPSSAESYVLSPIVTTNYYSGAVSMISSIPAHALYLNTNASAPALPPDAAGEPVAFIRLNNTSNIATTWSWGGSDNGGNSTLTDDQARALLVQTLSKLNKNPADLSGKPTPLEDKDVKAFLSHVYFPRFEAKELQAGFYAKLGILQGQLNTYYASGLNGFETVEFAVRAGIDVVDSYF